MSDQDRRRILFVNGTSYGGSLMSTRGLAEAVAARGHAVTLVHGLDGQARTARLHKRLENLHAHVVARPASARLGQLTRLLAERPGARPTRIQSSIPTYASVVPANAALRLWRRMDPQIVVCASILRPQWRQLNARSQQAGVPVVLYLREDTSLDHLGPAMPSPDLLLANSEALVAAAAERGQTATMVPSLVDLSASRSETTRRAALIVNGNRDYGGDRALRLAEALPDVEFVVQQSWPIAGEVDELRQRAERLPNVEVRSFTAAPAEVYRDARVLLAPYEAALRSHRPRCVLEAQANGIPVIGSATPGLRETVGQGGILIAEGAPDDEWEAAIRSIWDDVALERALVEAALLHAARPSVDPSAIVERFLTLLGYAWDKRSASR